MVIDACTMFNCRHEFVCYPFGFVCHKCEHQRPELPIDGDRRLIFFPAVDTAWTDAGIAKQAFAQSASSSLK